MPGTGPEMSATFARVMVVSVIPVWFLNPSHEAAFAVPVGEPLPLDLPPPFALPAPGVAQIGRAHV